MRICVLALFALAGCSRAGEASFDGLMALGRIEEQLAMGPRFPGSDGHAVVQAWLPAELAELGWEAQTDTFTYRGTPLANITARRDPAPGPLILLGAHYDTRRFADRDPIAPGEPVPGANDGASGVAVLLELARVLGGDDPSCDLRLVFFDGEDNGGIADWEWAVGARHYAGSLTEEPLAVVVVDMVGDADLDLPLERTSSPDLAAEIWSAAQARGLPAFRSDPGPAVLDDHTPFLARGWRAVDIIDLTYPAWHTVDDTFDRVSAESLDQVGEALLAWLAGACLPLEG
jgi:acetylornithine deacetylase/succinyl-diaminopimelate desuccinylase-like protein